MGAVAAGISAAGSILGGITGGKGAAKAAKAQAKAIQAGIDEQHQEFATEQKNFAPYLAAGGTGLQAQLDLLGLGGTNALAATPASGASPMDLVNYLAENSDGHSQQAIKAYIAANPNMDPTSLLNGVKALAGHNELQNLASYAAANPYTAANPGTTGTDGSAAQAKAIAALKASPLFTSLYGTGQDTILQNASATGGLRGGNTENSLAQFGSSLLSTVIQNQLASYAGLANQGLGATNNISSLGQQSATNVSNLLNQKGQAQSAGILGQTAGLQSIISGISGAAGNYFGGLSGGGGAGNTALSTFNPVINNLGSGGLNF